jgi:23S rRNA (cytosine1962-C5)-methyltransferase
MAEEAIILRAGREKSVLSRHPWIFASAIDEVEGEPGLGDTTIVFDSRRKFLARAAYSPSSQIRARVWTLDEKESIDQAFLKKRIYASIERRLALKLSENTNALRLIYGEADGIPGLVVDQYANTLVMQLLSAGAEKFKAEIIEVLVEVIKPEQIYERSDVEIRQLEGLQPREGLVWGMKIDHPIEIKENGLKYNVDVTGGQKTGFYIDQRRNRQKIYELAKDKQVLNCFCYTGGFTLNALAGGASNVTSVDSSGPALEQLKQNVRLNSLDESKSEIIEGDVFTLLRKFRDQARSFDLIVLDPPKFAPTISQAEKASRAYKDINLLAIKLLKPGGILVTFSCSGGISRDLFQKIIAGAALDASVDLRIIDQLSQSPDHPVLTSFPESFYLKGLICVK